MKLEVITRKPDGATRPTPLLFVHGAFSSAHIWTPFFLPFFAEHGYEAHALSLRGHGGSEGKDRLSVTRLRDYVNDVAEVAGGLSVPPVLIGTSMGGIIAQKYMHEFPVPAVVLLASGPPHGMLPSIMRMALGNPQLVRDMFMMQYIGPDTATIAGARRALFRADTPDEYIRRYLPKAEHESPWVMTDMVGLDLPPSIRRVEVPVLVLGGECDAFIAPTAVEATAGTYATEAEIFPDMPHAMMLDRDWERVARRILDWLDGTLSGQQSAGVGAEK
jgi:pimeloyl-ACP methyl ester carboxylesterase